MAAYKSFHYSYGDYDEIAFTSRNDMNLAVWEGEGRLRLYSYSYEDTFRERVGRFIHNGITQLWEDQALFDLEVVICGKVFKCHRTIMASVSGFFKAELTSELLTTARRVGLPDVIVLDENFVKPEIFQNLLELIYKGKDVVSDDRVLDLMKAATHLKIRSLEYRCLNVLVQGLGERSCMKTWDWAEANNIPSLASKAKGIALSHFQVLRHTEDFLQIPIERLTMMLGHELLQYRCEDDILEAILDWVEFDANDRRLHLKALLPFVCFPYLSTRYLNDLRKHDLIGLQTEYASYVDEALTYHLAALQKDGKKIQMEVLKRQAHLLKRLTPGMRHVVVLLGGAVVQDEPLTNVVACYLDMAHPQSRYREILQFSIASLPMSPGVHFASTVWNHDIYVSGGSRAPDTLIVYKPHENTWHMLQPLPQWRKSHAMVALNGKLYLVGGRMECKAGDMVVSEIIEYDIEAKTWKQTGKLALAVELAPAVTISDKIYVFGGRDTSGGSVSAVQCLDTGTGQTSIVGEMPVGVEGAKAIVLGKDIILVCPDGNIFKVSSSRMGDPGRSGESIGKEKLKKLSFVEVKGDEENKDDSCEGESVKEKESSMNQIRFEHTDEEVKSTESADQNKWGKEKEKADEDLSDWEFTEQMEGKREPNKKVEEKLEDVDRSTITENHQVTEEKEDQVDSGVKQVEEEKEEQKKEETDDTVMENDLVKEEEKEQKEEADDRIEENYPAKEEQEEDANDRLLENCPAKAEEEAEEEVDDRLMENYQVKEEEEEGQKEEEADKDQKAVSTADPVKLDILTTQYPAPMISIKKIATMEKRCDFGLFIHKADVMVVGGQAENGNFLDDMLRIHVPTGQVCKADGKLAIPLSGMQVESTAIHQNYLVQFFDTTSCFYGE